MEKIPLVFKCLMLGCAPLCARITSGHMQRRPHLCARCAARGSRAAATCTAMSSTDTRRRRNTAVTGVTAPLKPGNQQQSFELAQPHLHSHHHHHHHRHPHLHHQCHHSPHCDQQQHWFCERIRTRDVGIMRLVTLIVFLRTLIMTILIVITVVTATMIITGIEVWLRLCCPSHFRAWQDSSLLVWL